MSAITPTLPSDKTPPQPTPARQRIGAGSFATVFIVHGGPCAYKVIHDTTNAETLLKEYTMLSSLHLTCNPDSFFALPRPFVFHNPQTNVLTVQPQRSLHRSPRLTFSAETFSTLGFTAPTYVMDRVFILPLRISNPIRDLYYPPHAKETNPPPLCRLYFGKVLDVAPVQTSRPNHFFNSSNFPLDVARYTALAAHLPLPPVAEVVEGMGEMLARLHWRGNVDGRDIEFVMGGDGYEGISFFVIDFNQMRNWGKVSAGIPSLVSSFMDNDPYFPRARPPDPLYQIFRTAYLGAYPEAKEHRAIGLAFLSALESEQASRDNIAP